MKNSLDLEQIFNNAIRGAINMKIVTRIEILKLLVENQMQDDNTREICVDKKMLMVLIELAENEIGERVGTSADISLMTVEEFLK